MRHVIVLALTVTVAAWAATLASAQTKTCAANTGVSLTSGLRATAGGTASVSFTVAQGCDIQLTLVSYKAPSATFSQQTASQQVVFDSVTGTYSAGTTLTVAVPNCDYQVDFVYGTRIDHLGPAGSNNFYGAQGRLIQSAHGGTSSCESTGGETGGQTGGETGGTSGGETGGNGGETGTPSTPPSETPPPPVPAPTITLVKLERIGATGDYVPGPLTAHVGDTISYRIVVTNTGTTDVSVNLTDGGCVGVAPTGPQAIRAGASLAFTCTHLVTFADGALYTNTASATATNAGPVTATAQSTVVANIPSTSTSTSTGGVLGATTTVKKAKHKAVHHKVRKVKKVVHKAKAAHAVLAAGGVTG